MKKITLLLGFIAASFAVSNTVSAQAVLGPKISFEQDFVDYGEVDYSGPSERVWKFKNTGQEPLIITGATGSCGCTVPSYPKEPIMPGKTGEIKINYDTKRSGPIAKTVTVTTNETNAAPIVIHVKGNVKANPTPAGAPTTTPTGPAK